MLHIFLKNNPKYDWYIMLPHEINNEFLFDIDQYTKNYTKKWGHLDVGASDFGAVEYPPEKLDKLYKDFEVLENNLNEITKVVPLPETIGNFDGHYWEGYISFFGCKENELKKSFPNMSIKEIQDLINKKNLVDGDDEYIKKFAKEDMLLIISLIKKKILEAKEKGDTLVFSGD